MLLVEESLFVSHCLAQKFPPSIYEVQLRHCCTWLYIFASAIAPNDGDERKCNNCRRSILSVGHPPIIATLQWRPGRWHLIASLTTTNDGNGDVTYSYRESPEYWQFRWDWCWKTIVMTIKPLFHFISNIFQQEACLHFATPIKRNT